MADKLWGRPLAEAAHLRVTGNYSQAAVRYKQALFYNSDLPEAWYNLGWVQRQIGAFEESVASYREALKRGIKDPQEVHVNIAVIQSDYLHNPQEAESELLAALEIDREYVPALLNLGNLYEDLGQRDAALHSYQRALTSSPGHALALARICGLSHSPVLNQDLADAARSAIANAGCDEDFCDLSFALASLLDAAGEYDEAFQVAREANERRLATIPKAGLYQPDKQEEFVRRQIDTFAVEAAPPGPSPEPAILLICGIFRSGSTLLETMLSAHSGVAPGGELNALPALASGIRGYPERIRHALPAEFEKWRELYSAALLRTRGNARVITDKTPENFLHIGFLKTLYPGAKIVHTTRNPWDNLLSLYFLNSDPRLNYALDLGDAVHWYKQHQRLMAHWKEVYPNDVLEVRYEDLVQNPRDVLGNVLAFCGLEWEDSLMDFHETARPVKTASVWQVRERLHNRSVGRHLNYKAFLGDVMGELASPSG